MKLKQILQQEENKKLLLQYEASLPAWTVVFAQYTGYYRPWQRKILRIITFIASIITVSIGFYDLYKHFPLFSDWLNSNMFGLVTWIEQMIALRMTLLISYIIYFSEPLQQWAGVMFAAAEYTQIERLFFPLIYFCKSVKGIVIILYELILPVNALIMFICSSLFNVVWGVLNLPFYFVSTSYYFIVESCVTVLTTVQSVVKPMQQVIQPVSNAETRETTITLIQLAT